MPEDLPKVRYHALEKTKAHLQDAGNILAGLAKCEDLSTIHAQLVPVMRRLLTLEHEIAPCKHPTYDIDTGRCPDCGEQTHAPDPDKLRSSWMYR